MPPFYCTACNSVTVNRVADASDYDGPKSQEVAFYCSNPNCVNHDPKNHDYNWATD